jgi:hypothetical protein
MPVVHFSGSTVPPIPPRVYLDTSFLFRCYFGRVTPTGLSAAEQSKNAACNSFLTHLSVSAMHVSLLAVEEALHTAYFKTHVIRLSKQNGFGIKWKDFRQQRPSHFQGARTLGLLEVKRFAAFLDTLPVKFIDSDTYVQRSDSIPFVIKYARLVLEKYSTIEVMDTYHVALMRVNRIDWFVTAEQRLGTGFDEFSVLTL